METNNLLEVRELKKYFLVTKKSLTKDIVFLKAVDGVTFSIHKGEILGLVGESGSGKSTVAYTIMGMYEPTFGKIFFCGEEITTKHKKRSLSIKGELQIVFQDPSTSLNPRRNIRYILERPLKIHRISSSKNVERSIIKLLEMVELPSSYLDKYPHSMGGGEKQLISIARALATKPKLVILDEPTSALDVSIQGKIINKLMKIKEELHISYLFITHDLSLMRNVADRVAIMYLGRICEIAKTEDFFKNPSHPYTMMLLSSIPVISNEEEVIKPRNIHSQGEITSPVNIPIGCRFNTRCPYAKKICYEVEPPFVEVSTEHKVRCYLKLK